MLASPTDPLPISSLPLLGACAGGLLASQPSAAVPPPAAADPRAAQVGALNLAKMLRGKS